ncbi:ricin-type beta-trefoil lectin domain protein [Streptomyces sp. NPDC099050]|uniref:ricin-type beta-trefoil lectin domain protein n=1 Tax=Streptomyces sp. NPDC099050 TaxID=3366100 RepID=UPI0038176F30
MVLSALLTITLLPTESFAAPPGGRTGVPLVDLVQEQPAELDEAAAEQLRGWSGVPAQPPAGYEPVKTAPPAPGSADVALSGDQLIRAGTLPVSIGKASPTESAPVPPTPSGTWSVEVAARTATEAAGVDGALITLTPPATGATPVDVQLDYEKFEDLYGTEWSTRLELRQLPQCFLTTPDLPECTTAQEIPSTNDPATGTVRATVDPALAPGQSLRTMAVGAGSPVVIAASDAGAGAGGTFKATSLEPSGSWTAGGAGGGFSWSYPLNAPSVPAGPAPQISFSYSSQAVDGRTSVSNGQASWIGDGWGYEPGFIERRYRSCSADRKTTPAAPNNNNSTDKTKGDLCWSGDSVVMSLGGSTTELVRDATTGAWIPASDDGSRVERKTDPANGNGAKDGEYWVVTTRDGTRYHFGRHNVGTHVLKPGQTRTTTDSVFTVPVVGNHPGEPCHAATYAASFCTQGWRWNLDYVEDTNGNAMIIDWAKESNRYGKNGKYKEKVSYVRGGHPLQISYGLRASALSAVPSGRVEFTVAERCIEATAAACADAKFESKNYGDKQAWWDTPATLHCKEGTGDCYIGSPTFWTRKRLTSVTTWAQRTFGSTDLSKVDHWTLDQSFPKQRTDTHPPLWLESITRTGYGTDKNEAGDQLSITLPAVSFRPNVVDMPNRVATSATDATPDFDRLRVETIRTETGGDIHVDYSDPCPVGGSHPKPEENTGRCFPAYWSPDDELENPPLQWFNKYVVDRITERDRVARQPDVVTAYTYEGGAAWGKETDEFSKPEMRTYNQWRGYAEVTTRRGVADATDRGEATEQSQTRTRYFRGMSGDGGRPKVVVKDSTGTQELGEDLPHYQGRVAETITYGKSGGSVDVRELTWPWSQKTATRTRDGTTPLEAHRSGTTRTETYTAVSGGRTQLIRSEIGYETTYGLPTSEQTQAFTSNGTGWTPGEARCNKTDYVHNTTAHLIGLPQRARSTTGDCASSASGTMITDVRTSYDAPNAFGTAPTKGNPSQVDTPDAAGSGWVATSRSEYDALGRVVKSYDAAGNFSTTAFTPATGTPFSTKSTNPLGHAVTTTLDPGRGSALVITDPNNRKVTQTYDALGRVTAAWTPGQNPATDKAARTFDYQIEPQVPPVVTSRKLRDNGTYEEAVAIYDGLLRPRQNQTEALGGGRLVVDTFYNAVGSVRRTNNTYYAEGEPTKEVFVPETDFHVPSTTHTSYDGRGRAVRTTNRYSDPAQTPYASTTEYGGDYTLTRSAMSDAAVPAPMLGSKAVKETLDVFGRKILTQHAVTTTSPMTWRDISYAFDARGNLSKVTDAAGSKWTYAYDARGRMTDSQDPDMGRALFGYNVMDQQVWAQSNGGQKTFFSYDKLGRKTAEAEDADTNPPVATWTYDTLPSAKGYPVAATRQSGGLTITTEVTGYDAEYRPTGSRIIVPDAPATKGVSGIYGYTTSYTKTGKVQAVNLPPTPGGLAAERLITRYNSDGAPVTLSGLSWYMADAVYSPFGQILRTATGNAPQRVWTTNLYNQNTGRLRETITDRETADPYRVNSLSYKHDVLGNIQSITDTQPGGRVDQQCFQYDALGQLTQAWTGKTCAGPVETDVTAGPDGDGYRQSYAFDNAGNRTKLTSHDLANPALNDEYTYTYGVTTTNGSQPPVTTQPHTLAKVDAVTRTAGSTVSLQSTFGYDASGNTTRRTIGGDTQTLEWDRRNKLTRAVSPGIGSLAVTGMAGKCLDIQSGAVTDGTPVQIYACNETKAQQWRLTGETVRALDKCLTAQGADAVLATCDGSAKQKFQYRGDKTLYNPAANACVTIPNDNPVDGNDLDIYQCQPGAASQQWSFDATTTYLYDADGNRVVQETGSSRTLYLGEAEVTVNKAGVAIDATRSYSGDDGPTTVRRTYGQATGHKLTANLSDHHGTSTTTVDQAAGQAVTRRKFDPYGNVRGSVQSNWSDKRTFLGVGVDDNTTNLTHIGAREYDASTGRFLSVDPVLDVTDPLQMNGYAYSNGDPVNQSDPTGLESCYGAGFCSGTNGTYGPYDPNYGNTPTTSPPTPTDKGNGGKTVQVVVKKSGNTISINGSALPTQEELVKKWHFSPKMSYEENLKVWLRPTCGKLPGSADVDNSLCTGARNLGWLGETPDIDYLEVVGLRDPYECVVNGDGGACQDAVVGLSVDAALTIGTIGVGKAAKIVFKGIKASMKKGNGGVPLQCLIDAVNSFPAGTPVQLADGTTKPIEELKNGDVVLATDPETGLTEGQPVTAVIVTDTDKEFVELTLDAEGVDSTLVTTDRHSFWSESARAWREAGDLTPGSTVRTDDGTAVEVKANRPYAAAQRTYNLTVAALHTYYVLAVGTPVLVHNDNCPIPQGHTSQPAFKEDPYNPTKVQKRSEDNAELYKQTVADRARDLGYTQKQADFYTHKQPTFWNGKQWISPDVDGHNVDQGWKVFNRQGQRIGTYDRDFNYVKK